MMWVSQFKSELKCNPTYSVFSIKSKGFPSYITLKSSMLAICSLARVPMIIILHLLALTVSRFLKYHCDILSTHFCNLICRSLMLWAHNISKTTPFAAVEIYNCTSGCKRSKKSARIESKQETGAILKCSTVSYLAMIYVTLWRQP